MTKPRYFYLIEKDQLTGWPKTGAPVEAVLDMLQRDYARIELNTITPEGFYLLSADHRPSIEGWASFGVEVAWVGQDPYEAFLATPTLRKR